MPSSIKPGSGYAFPGPGAGSSGSPYFNQQDWPEGAAQAGNTILYELWFPVATTISSIVVYMDTINTQGTYLLVVTNQDTAATMLSAANFSMNTLVANTVTSLPLTATAADLVLPANTRMTLSLASNDANFDGSGIYIATYATAN